MITVFTPTYNRAHTLGKLYESLVRQTNFNFEWLIVDDGSTDVTENLIKSFRSNENNFSIQYYKQKNGGKHRAINKGVKLAKGEYFFIVDSDDHLTSDAIELLEIELEKTTYDDRCCGVTALRVSPNGEWIGTKITSDVLVTDFLSFRYKYKAQGDRAEVLKTEILKKYPFPEFEGENFCTEAVIWYEIAQKYVSHFINLPVYVCEYLPEGLTDTYGKIMQKNIKGTIYYYKQLFKYHIPIKDRMLAGVNFWNRYSKISEPEKRLKPTISLILFYSLSFLLTFYLKYKNRKI